MIDFEIPPDIEKVRREVADFIDTEVLPVEDQVGTRPYFEIVRELQAKARARGLWCPFIPKELGGMGLGHLANAVVQVEIGRSFSFLAAWAFNCMGPQDATMLTVSDHGTPEQKERFLKPVIDGHKRMCFSMTERAVGADATGMQTRAVRDGDDWVINGEKWFASMASISDYVLLMARTSDDGPRHERFTTFLVELPSPGFHIVRDIPTMDEPYHHAFQGETTMGHAEVLIENLRVPHANIIGGIGQGFNMGQHRLGYGRLRHGMWSVARAQAALDMATKHVMSRETFGQRVADRQGVQWMLADCATQLYITRLMILHIAYKMERGLDLRQENSIAKNYIAHMIEHVIDTAIQLHGSLGYSLDMPFSLWRAEYRQQRLADGPDEIHRWLVGRNVVKAFERFGTTASAAGGDLF